LRRDDKRSRNNEERSRGEDQEGRVDAARARTTLRHSRSFRTDTELSPSNKAHNLLKEQKRTNSEGCKSNDETLSYGYLYTCSRQREEIERIEERVIRTKNG